MLRLIFTLGAKIKRGQPPTNNPHLPVRDGHLESGNGSKVSVLAPVHQSSHRPAKGERVVAVKVASDGQNAMEESREVCHVRLAEGRRAADEITINSRGQVYVPFEAPRHNAPPPGKRYKNN